MKRLKIPFFFNWSLEDSRNLRKLFLSSTQHNSQSKTCYLLVAFWLSHHVINSCIHCMWVHHETQFQHLPQGPYRNNVPKIIQILQQNLYERWKRKNKTKILHKISNKNYFSQLRFATENTFKTLDWFLEYILVPFL